MRKDKVYYNENDPFAAQWLRNLIGGGHLPRGDVDSRSIEEVKASDLVGYRQCHFFAGIGGWPYALRLAGWGDDREVWTGSCPCQSLSVAGNRMGTDDPRHLWPDFFRLIEERRPPTVFGEQVASEDGRVWLAGVRADLEALEYAVGAADLCSAGVGAPDIRQRLYWVADSSFVLRSRRAHNRRGDRKSVGKVSEYRNDNSASFHGLAHADGGREGDRELQRGGQHGQRTEDGRFPDRMGISASTGFQKYWKEYRPRGERCRGLAGFASAVDPPSWNGPTVAVKCSDGARRVSAQPDAFPLAHGVPNRLGLLRGAGNAINPILAARFVEAFLETKT